MTNKDDIYRDFVRAQRVMDKRRRILAKIAKSALSAFGSVRVQKVEVMPQVGQLVRAYVFFDTEMSRRMAEQDATVPDLKRFFEEHVADSGYWSVGRSVESLRGEVETVVDSHERVLAEFGGNYHRYFS